MGLPAGWVTDSDELTQNQQITALGNGVLPVGVHSPGFVADTDAEAREILRPHWLAMRNKLGAERGWGRASNGEFDAAANSPTSSLYVGSPDTVARKIVTTVSELGLSRFNLKYSSGTLPHEHMLRSIELYGTEVIPRVRQLLAETQPTSAPEAIPVAV